MVSNMIYADIINDYFLLKCSYFDNLRDPVTYNDLDCYKFDWSH